MSSRRYWLLCVVRHPEADLGQIEEMEELDSDPHYPKLGNTLITNLVLLREWNENNLRSKASLN